MNSIAIIINSCEKFYRYSIDPIIESSKKAKIPTENIYVIVGDSNEETDIIKKDDYNIVFCRFTNIDYNGAIYFSQTEQGLNILKKYTHFFYTHDTTCFMDCFWEKIMNYSINCNEYIKIENLSSKNIGLINVEWFINNKKELFSYYINYDKSLFLEYKAGDFPNKDIIYSKFNNLPRWLNEDCLFLFNNHEPLGMVFNNAEIPRYIIKKYTNTDRMASEYKEPGIIKYQTNWGQGGSWNLEL